MISKTFAVTLWRGADRSNAVLALFSLRRTAGAGQQRSLVFIGDIKVVSLFSKVVNPVAGKAGTSLTGVLFPHGS